MRLENRTALVTGGASGIGAATCRRLAAEGARVAVTDMNLEGAREVADEITGAAYELDVRSEESIRAAVDAAEAELGPIDALINNAGYDEWGFFTNTDPDLWDRVLAVNLRGVIAVTHAVLPGMQERRRGRIVNTASEAGRVGSSGSAIYSAAKAGVIGFTKAIAIENGRYGITSNAIAPGPIDTPLLMAAPEAFGDLGKRLVENMVGSTNLRRLGQPDEVAAAIVFLASDDASYITGQALGRQRGACQNLNVVSIREVGPRDGFQNEPEVIATDDKVRLVEMLARTGLRRLEVTSFVRADVIPQLADGAEVLRRADIPDDVAVSVLIPNERGLESALAVREHFAEVNLFLSASETHNRKNVNRSIEESLAGLERVIERARGEGLRCEGVISVVFGCPYEGDVPRERVLAIARRLVGAGCEEIAFGDTTGMANPAQVASFFDGLDLGVELTAHFHNTRGQGLANVVAALGAGVRSFESSFGELGGCPVPPGPTGNIASEDLVSMLHEMGHDTGIDLERLVACAREAQRVLGRPLGSHVLTAGPVDWHRG